MSYAKLEKNCIEKTIAITNNKKFIPIDSSIYYQPYTNMLKYPVGEQIGNVDTKNPNQLKSYYNKQTSPYFNEDNQDTLKNTCSTCS
jgi:hypothetical protein